MTKLSESDFRLLKEMSNWYRQTKSRLSQPIPGRSAAMVPPPIPFKNDSGEAVPAYACMKVTGAEEGGVTGAYYVVIDKPDSTGGPFLFNGPLEVGTGKFGQAHSGIVRAAYNTGTPAVGEIWGPKSTWTLQAAGDPALEIYGEINAADDIVYGSMTFQSPTVLGKADAAITKDASGTVSIWAGSTLADTTENITAHLIWMHGDENISLGKEVMCQWFPQMGKWIIVGADCE